MVKKVLTALLISLLINMSALVLDIEATSENENKIQSTPVPKLFVEPSEKIYHLGVGDTFAIKVSVANVTNLLGVTFKLSWNASLLNGVLPASVGLTEELYAAHTPAGEEDNIWKIKHLVAADVIEYKYSYLNSTRAISGGYAPFNITVEDGYPEGKFTVAIITLELIANPPPYEQTCILDIVECHLTSHIPAPIVHYAYDGLCSFHFLIGDLNYDFAVDILDAIAFANVFHTDPNSPNWNPSADMYSDDWIDIFDAIMLSNHFGEKWV